MLLYILYNADLLEIAENPEEESLGFIDDTISIVEGDDLEENVGTLTNFMNRNEGGFAWSDAHNSHFTIDKLAVSHYSKKRVPDPQRPGHTVKMEAPKMKLKGEVVREEKAYKYLGIHVDNQLDWKTQTHEAISRAAKWILLYKRLMKSTSGLSTKFMRRLYIMVAIPKMTYGLDVWYTPPYKELGRKRNTGSVKALREFGKLQRIATLAITGTLRTTPNNLLDAHSGLLPADLMLKNICHRALTRLCTLPLTNPVASQIETYHNQLASRHPTNIQHLFKIFRINPITLETIPATAKPPNYRLPIDMLITDSKEESIEDEPKDKVNIRIYTDGSSQNGFVGAAAVMYYPRNGALNKSPRILQHQLGTDKEYSVWDAEAVGGLMALWLLRGSNRISHLPISIYSDSQAFIKSIGTQQAKSGYHIVSHFTRQAETLISNAEPTRNPERIKLRWIAAHENVKGNERVDEEVKKSGGRNFVAS